MESLTVPFIGESLKSSTDTLQHPLGYFFGTSSYADSYTAYQTYYGSTSGTLTTSTYYIPKALKEVNVTKGNILYGAFQNCTNIEKITVPNDITNIGSYAFFKCDNLESMEIPNTVVELGEYAFYRCKKLSNMEIPESIVTIGTKALLFEGDPFDVVTKTTYDSYEWTNDNGVYSSSNQGRASSTSSMIVEISQTGTLSFKYVCYAEANYDYLVVEKNGVKVFDTKSSSSNRNYTSYSMSVNQGDKIRFYFYKDQYTNEYDDCARVKDFAFVAE